MSAAAAARALRILFVTSECAPWIKTGGLGDVSAALPRALVAAGHDVRVLMPAYRRLRDRLNDAEAVVAPASSPPWPAARLGRIASSGASLWLLDCPELYDRPGASPYLDERGVDYTDNARRFGFLSHVAARLCAADGAWPDWRADVLHANDWQTGLAPAYLRRPGGPRAASVFTIHNLAFQGLFAAALAPELDLPAEWLDVHRGLLHWGRISTLKAGVRYADAITTVSPTYAREIQTEALGLGMDGMLRLRAGSLHGILNGVDTELWNPLTDPLIASRYGPGNWAAKAANKTALQRELGLVADADAPLLGIVSRLTEQKGIDLVLDGLDALLGRGCQLAVVGSGEARLEQRLIEAGLANPGRIAARIGFDERLAHLIEAGADSFLMPSRFEPCGLNQMYSLLYGTPPLVHATGGLADTVRDVAAAADGTGFVMAEPSVGAFVDALDRVVRAYADRPGWRRLQRRGMAERFDWSASAERYVQVYRRCIGDGRTG